MQRLLGAGAETQFVCGQSLQMSFLYTLSCVFTSFCAIILGVPCLSLPVLYFPWSRVLPISLSHLPDTPEGGEQEGGRVKGSLRSMLESLSIVRMVTKALFVGSFYLDT